MKVFICGSCYPDVVVVESDRQAILKAASMIGEELCRLKWSLVVGTDIPDSVDRYVVNGALAVARRRRRKAVIEVHYIEQDGRVPYSELDGDGAVRITFHPVPSTNWHVAHLRAAENADAALLIAGRRGTLVSGLLCMLHGIPFLPLMCFGYAAREIWEVAKTDVRRYFFDEFAVGDIERITGRWSENTSPEEISKSLARLVNRSRKERGPQQAKLKPRNRRIFIVHGRDEAPKESLARYLTQLNLTPIILHEQPSDGKTIIEKFEAYADVAFAVVLLTPDDVGGSGDNPGNLEPRARQNVIFELGFFFAGLGRGRVAVLHKGELEIPSDYAGIVYIKMDDAAAWKVALAREMKSAGLRIDLNRAIM